MGDSVGCRAEGNVGDGDTNVVSAGDGGDEIEAADTDLVTCNRGVELVLQADVEIRPD